eukprot:749092-Hanusia_phi.AAC.10
MDNNEVRVRTWNPGSHDPADSGDSNLIIKSGPSRPGQYYDHSNCLLAATREEQPVSTRDRRPAGPARLRAGL